LQYEVPNPPIDTRGMGAIKNFGGGAYEKFPIDKFFISKKFPHLWGGKGGPSFHVNRNIMIDIRFNNISKFGLGFEFRSDELHHNYSMKRLHVHLLIITISFVITKFNI
jgi:hypothetical protein